jgi:hypothetical protein
VKRGEKRGAERDCAERALGAFFVLFGSFWTKKSDFLCVFCLYFRARSLLFFVLYARSEVGSSFVTITGPYSVAGWFFLLLLVAALAAAGSAGGGKSRTSGWFSGARHVRGRTR